MFNIEVGLSVLIRRKIMTLISEKKFKFYILKIGFLLFFLRGPGKSGKGSIELFAGTDYHDVSYNWRVERNSVRVAIPVVSS